MGSRRRARSSSSCKFTEHKSETIGKNALHFDNIMSMMKGVQPSGDMPSFALDDGNNGQNVQFDALMKTFVAKFSPNVGGVNGLRVPPPFGLMYEKKTTMY